MELSRFSDPEFDAKEWINNALRSKDAQTPMDAHASMLVMKLQLFIQEVNGALEETSQQVMDNLPRVLRDVEGVRHETSLLKEQMHIVREDIKKVESDTALSMQKLVDLDALKTRMVDSQSALKEADNWTTLSSDVDTVFESQDIQKIAEKLSGMQQSLKVLHDVPDFEERKKLLEMLKNRLEALVSPRLIAAFNSQSADETIHYVKIFTDMNRYPQLESYYVGSQKVAVVELWSAIYDPSKHLHECLTTFYDELLSKWLSKLSWCSQVFLNPLGVLSTLFFQALDLLDPPLARCLDSAVQESRNPLATLSSLRQVTLRFVGEIEKSVAKFQDTSAVFRFVETVHVPYCQLLIRYQSLELQLLQQNLQAVKLLEPSGMDDVVSNVSKSVPEVFTWGTEALERCGHVTDGWGLCGLLKTLESFFSQYLSTVARCVQEVRSGCGLDQESPSTGTGASRNKSRKAEKQEEWIPLQGAFNLIQCCGEMILRTASLNAQICSAVAKHTPPLRSPSSPQNPFGSFNYLQSLRAEEYKSLMQLLDTVENGEGETQLLSSMASQVCRINNSVHKLAFDVLFSELKQKLAEVPTLKVWGEVGSGGEVTAESPGVSVPHDHLPQFSLSPLPYITEIGDYLLTLPQELEPFTASHESAALMAAFKAGSLPYPGTVEATRGGGGGGGGGGEEELAEGEEEHPWDAWLGAIARGTVDTYIHSILLIPAPLAQEAALQLATDIAYLLNVLSALGQHTGSELTQMEKMLSADQERFQKLEDDSSLSRGLYHGILKLRTGK